MREGPVAAFDWRPGESAATQEKVGNAPDVESAEHVAPDAFDAMATWIASQTDIACDRIRAASARMREGDGPADPPLRYSDRIRMKPDATRNAARGVSDGGTFVPM
ncbi:hypothetical protein [Lysobacter changpingensis]|uniref:hypothetical protein n=1 Tax=Lysobacter changpingensis TaxID=2792784 RepID=UPI001A8ECF9D|nr:hypothetical protein [Lysobacter changpingensis]